MIKRILSLFIVSGLFFSVNLKAQSLQETLSKLSSTVGAQYVKPVISAFGSNLNSGWVTNAPSASKLEFHLDVKIIAMGSFFSDDVKNFVETGQFYFSQDQASAILNNTTGLAQGSPTYVLLRSQLQNTPMSVTFSGPTIVGKKNQNLNIIFPGQSFQGYNLPATTFSMSGVSGFLDELPVLPTAAAQVTVGTVFGTNFAFRYFPDVDIKDMGKFSFWGAGLIHNPGVWFPNPIPVDFGIGYFIQKMKVGSMFESTTSQFGVYVSKTFGAIISFTPYAGLTMETSKTTVSYNYQSNQVVSGATVPPINIAFEIEGENTSSAVVGFTLHLAAVNINADYKLAKTKTASAGISFGL
ncbi:MAG: hypothetical protein NTZ27_07225 [Ignavibacteriales bacterium]|nr:hypothetical protein [Ignavibacteriales bacterium]